MKNIIYIISVIITFNGFAQDKDVSIDSLFCKKIKKININDQKYRKLLQDPFFKVYDSVVKSQGFDNLREYAKVTSKSDMLKNGRIARKITSKLPKMPQRVFDSIMDLQIIEDNKNTELLIDIINKRGYPNVNNCNCPPKELNFLIVFRHSQTKYFDEIRTLIEHEYKAKRLPEKKYKLFLDHINGRTGKGL